MSLPVDFLERARRNLNLADFASGSAPYAVRRHTARPPVDRQYILRMMVRSPSLPLTIPTELAWLEPTIRYLDAYQKRHSLHNPYIYVTVRHGIVTSTTDDEWHVDGFSMRYPHVPEQNYICVNGAAGTWFSGKPWNIPATFDPLKHNIHRYLQQHGADDSIYQAHEDTIYAIDPYCVHKRPPTRGAEGRIRTFWRVSFVPIEIEDDTCTRNPLFPAKHYGRTDIRNQLTDWTAQ